MVPDPLPLAASVHLAAPGVIRISCGTERPVDVGDDAIEVKAADGGLDIRDQEGNVLCASGQPDGLQSWRWTMPSGTDYFGLGERTGLLQKKGGQYTFWNTDQYTHQGPDTGPLYQSIPFYLAVDGNGVCHGVLIDSAARSTIDLSRLDTQTLTISADEPVLHQYVIAGPTPALVLQRLTRLTGRMPLPPRWALGYHHARWGYRDEAAIRDVTQQMRAHGVPADAVYFDIDHQDGFRTFTWDRERFPDPGGLISDLRGSGFKTAAIVNPAVKYQPEGGYDVFDDGVRHDVFLKEPAAPDQLLLRHVWPGLCAFPDFVRPEVRRWWGGWYSRLLENGIAAAVNDMNEPAMHDRPIRDKAGKAVDPPPQTRHGGPGHVVAHARVHNAYATFEAQAAYEGWRQLRPGDRPMILSRAGSTGIQQYAAVWTGDNRSLWEHLEMSLPQLLNLGLSGVPFCGADIGGFFGNCGPELLVRWYQLGAWYPLARANNAEESISQEPWVWDEQVLQGCRRALQLRYRLLPYWYTVFEESTRTGAPILRPLLYHYPQDAEARMRDDEALLGRDLLFAPVLRPGRVSREVYLPAGRWYGVHDGTVHKGPCTILAEAPIDGDMPVYARGGAILPTGPELLYTDEKPVSPLTLYVFPDEQGEAAGELYEDDGMSLSYLEGEMARTTFRYSAGDLTASTEGALSPPSRRTIVEVV